MKINSKKDLIEKLKDLKALEKEARNRYTEDLDSFKDFDLRFTIESIEKDEENHISIIEDLIAFL